MCASYGLTSDARRRREMERYGPTLFGEPEYFSEKVDNWIPAGLKQWLDEQDQEAT